jgi:hypothetical protein
MDPEPQTYAQHWGQHMAESRITDVLQDAEAGRPIPGVTLNDGFTLVMAEIASVHRFLLDLAVAVDDLIQTSGGTEA